MIEINKSDVLEVIEINPSFLIGKEMIFEHSCVEIIDVNLKCTHIYIKTPSFSTRWININDLEDKIDFVDFGPNNSMVTVKTILSIIKDKK